MVLFGDRHLPQRFLVSPGLLHLLVLLFLLQLHLLQLLALHVKLLFFFLGALRSGGSTFLLLGSHVTVEQLEPVENLGVNLQCVAILIKINNSISVLIDFIKDSFQPFFVNSYMIIDQTAPMGNDFGKVVSEFLKIDEASFVEVH